LNTAITYLFKERYYAVESKWLKNALAIYALYKCLYWILNFSLLFSENNIIYHNTVKLSWWKDPIFSLFNHPSSSWSAVFISGTIFFSLFVLLFRKHHRICFFLLWFLVSNINNNVFCTMTGGDALFQHLLFFCVFLGNNEPKQGVINYLDIAVHNTGVAALHVQICLVYFLNGIAKLADADWLNGNAISDSLAVHEFSLPLFYECKGTFSATLNYLVIWYQLLFPALVYIKKIKKWYLLIGIVQHIFIAVVLGLPSFGLIMIAAYTIFYVPFKKT
jgi:hypothetical protein